MSAAPNQQSRPNVAAAAPPQIPSVAGARPTPSTLPFAGQAGTGMLAGILGGIGIASLGAALHLRSRRRAAQDAIAPAGEPPTAEVSDLPLDHE